jgi:hypothetical protein
MSTEQQLSPEEVAAAKAELFRERLLEMKDEAIRDLQQLRAEIKRRQWAKNGPLWMEERLHELPWSKQREIMFAFHQHRRVAVQSCHDIGKSFIATRVATHWIDSFPAGEAFVVTTAPTTAQVKSILWRELGRAHTKGKLAGRVNQAEWYAPGPEGREEIVAFGRKPDEYDPTAFNGIHAPNVLVIIDEANGVRGPLHDAANSLIANDTGKMLMIGNPDDPSGEFYEACKPGSGWYVIKVGAFDSPNFTGEPVLPRVSQSLIGRIYVEERRKRWAPFWQWVDSSGQQSTPENGTRCVPPPGAKSEDTHPFWQSKILGEFPLTPQGVHPLLPLPWIKAAQDRTLEVADSDPIELGVDVGGGGDESTIALRKGGFVRIVKSSQHPDTMQVVSDVNESLEQFKALRAKIDSIGIGRGVCDRGIEMEKPYVGVNVGRASFEPDRFSNLRAQFWWFVRSLFEFGQIDIDPADEDLAAELSSLRYKPVEKGKILIESKDEARRRGVRSPNRADALMLALCDPLSFGTTDASSVASFAAAATNLQRESTWGFTGRGDQAISLTKMER